MRLPIKMIRAKMIRTIFAAALLLITHRPLAAADSEPQASDTAQAWLTTSDQKHLLERQKDLTEEPSSAGLPLTLQIRPEEQFQRIEGFGASMTESSASVIQNALAPAARNRLMKSLFDQEEGIGITLLRQPIAASDFALRHFTYCDQRDLESFSIENDRKEIIPLLKQALLINPSLRFIATPWSPPAWMKTSGKLIGGRLKPEFYSAYADYLTRFLKAYAEQGLIFHRITMQNEPGFSPPDYPGMMMDSPDQIRLARDFLAPAIRQTRLPTEILVWDHNWDRPDYPIAILSDEKARESVAGTAFHAYGGHPSAMSQVHERFPEKEIYLTEITAGEWAPKFGDNLYWETQTLLMGSLKNWAGAVLKFNLVLDEKHGPHAGGCTDCRGLIEVNRKTGKITRNYDYYTLGHFSRFVRPGAFRIASSEGNGVETIAFKNADGSIAAVLHNSSRENQEFGIRLYGKSYKIALSAGGVETLYWPARSAPMMPPTR